MKYEVKIPSVGESVNEVFIGVWQKKSGDIVKKDDVLLDLETQKATFELQAEQAGKLEILFPISGTKVAVGDVIAYIDSDAKAEVGTAKTETKIPDAQRATHNAPTDSTGILSPAAKKIAAEKNINPQTISGTGKDGRVTKEDVANYQPGKGDQPVSPTEVKPTPAIKPAAMPFQYQVDTARGERREPATRIRRQIAENLVTAQHTAAILTTFNEVDMTQLLAFRKKYKDIFKEKHGVSLGIVSLFAMACVQALKAFPLVNATYTGEDIIYRDFVDFSIAISTERGLVVPVLRDVDKMDVLQFEKALANLSEKAKNRKLSIPEMTGGTFTISNGGVFGSMLSTPILNMPQSGILGLHKTQDRAMVVGGKVVVLPMMYLALSYDHRIIDGKDAVQFLVKVKEGIENLEQIVDASRF